MSQSCQAKSEPEVPIAPPEIISPSRETGLGPADHQQVQTRRPESAHTNKWLAEVQASGLDLRQG